MGLSIRLIHADHEPLKKLIRVLKDAGKSLKKRKDAFIEFAALLTIHAKAEEQSLYMNLKGEKELRESGFEGEVEHQLAEQLMDETQRATDDDLWTARAKVLAEIVEHHIEEEEDEILPNFKECSEVGERVTLGKKYLRLKARIKSDARDVKRVDEYERPTQPQLQ